MIDPTDTGFHQCYAGPSRHSATYAYSIITTIWNRLVQTPTKPVHTLSGSALGSASVQGANSGLMGKNTHIKSGQLTLTGYATTVVQFDRVRPEVAYREEREHTAPGNSPSALNPRLKICY